MTFKRLFTLAAALLAVMLVACEKEPSTSGLYNDYLVYTDYDSSQDFSRFTTFFIPDSILVIGSRDKAEYWNDEHSREIVAELAAQLTQRGYTATTDKSAADVGMQLSYVRRVTYFAGCNLPYWWWEYPFYWVPGYWGDWFGWYYPYEVNYGYAAGSLLVEMLDLETPSPKSDEPRLTVVWDCFIGGLLSDSERLDTRRALEGIGQAFEQSPYLSKSSK